MKQQQAILTVVLLLGFSLVVTFLLSVPKVSTADVDHSLHKPSNNTKSITVGKLQKPRNNTKNTVGNQQWEKQKQDHEQQHEKRPEWMDRYIKFHAVQRAKFDASHFDTSSNTKQNDEIKFLVVVCLKNTQCGGVSDRLRSLPYWLSLAEQTDRVLLIHWNKKYALEQFWVPPSTTTTNGLSVNWTIPEHWLSSDPFQNCCISHRAQTMVEFHDGSNKQHITDALRGSEPVICLRTRADIAHLSEQYYPGNTMSEAFKALFAPTNELEEYINNTLADKLGLRPDDTFLLAQIRSTYPMQSDSGRIWPKWENHSNAIKSWARRSVESVISLFREHCSESAELPPVYVTSDSVDVVNYLLNSTSSWPTSIIGLKDIPRYHIELETAGNPPAAMYPVFFDLWMLSHAKCVSYGVGSFAFFGISIGGINCTIQHRSSLRWEDDENTVEDGNENN